MAGGRRIQRTGEYLDRSLGNPAVPNRTQRHLHGTRGGTEVAMGYSSTAHTALTGAFLRGSPRAFSAIRQPMQRLVHMLQDDAQHCNVFHPREAALAVCRSRAAAARWQARRRRRCHAPSFRAGTGTPSGTVREDPVPYPARPTRLVAVAAGSRMFSCGNIARISRNGTANPARHGWMWKGGYGSCRRCDRGGGATGCTRKPHKKPRRALLSTAESPEYPIHSCGMRALHDACSVQHATRPATGNAARNIARCANPDKGRHWPKPPHECRGRSATRRSRAIGGGRVPPPPVPVQMRPGVRPVPVQM